MADALRACLLEVKKIVDLAVKQGVVCHPVFLCRLPLDNEKFDELMTLVRACSLEDLQANAVDIDHVYRSLLDSGFVDAYLGIYFDVNNTTSCATVVSAMVYALDRTLRGNGSAVERGRIAETFVSRAANILYLRQLCEEDISDIENARYFSFVSVIDDVVRKVQSMNQERCEYYRFGIWDIL